MSSRISRECEARRPYAAVVSAPENLTSNSAPEVNYGVNV